MTTTDQTGTAAPSGKAPSRNLIGIYCIFAASFMQQIDTTIVNIALPHMQGSVQASHEQILWILTSYIVASAIMTAPAAMISSRIGRKTLLQICIAGFTLSSLLCGMAQSLEQLVIFRFLQGAAGGPIMPLGFAITLDNYQGQQRNKMMALFSMVVAFGPIVGPVVGGYLTETLNWRWCFLVNIPLGALIFAGIHFFFHDSADKRTPMAFDVFGFTVLSIALAALQLMLDRGPTKDWFGSPEIVIEAIVAGMAFYVFGVHLVTERKKRFVPPALFRDRNFLMGTLASTANVSLLYASSALLPVYLQTLGGRSVEETGLLLAPRGIGSIVGALGGAALMSRFNARTVMTSGFLLSAWSLWEMAHWTPDVGPWAIIFVSVVQGVSQSGLGAVNNSVSFSTVSSTFINDGTAISMLLRHIGGAILISICATVLAGHMQQMHEMIAALVSPFNRNLFEGAPGLFWNGTTPIGAKNLDALVNRNAEIVAYSNIFLLQFFVSFGILFAALGLREPSRLKSGAPQAQTTEL